ncbi:MAG: chemotaxis protein CheA [Betaproteobacteria bacterium]|nr:chemotaxis protein CheA [Betaproteobacteria bacterium]
MSDDLTAALASYAEESRELLEAMERALLEMEADGPEPERVNAVFRAAHTIKGSGGLFGFDEVVAFTHEVETVLEAVRQGDILMDGSLIGLLLECRDHMTCLTDASVAGTGTGELATRGDALAARLESRRSMPDSGGGSGNSAGGDSWHISLRGGQDLFRDGMDPLNVFRYLGTIGEIVRITTLVDRVPHLSAMDPESCYLGFELDFRTDASKAEIAEAFDFIAAESEIHLLPPCSKLSDWAQVIRALPEADEKVGSLLVSSGMLTRNELARALEYRATADESGPLGELLVEQRVVPREAADAALGRRASAAASRGDRFVRVDAGKLEQLITLVGELVISHAVVTLASGRSGDRDLHEAVATSTRFVEAVRDTALGLRMVQIGETFGRFQRVVRDLSQELGKKIDLDISGGDTELDKSIIDRIAEPLTHLVRNAMDHGIEPVAERLAAGKAPSGRLALNAYHETGSIVIEVTDDGRGLNRERIVAKATASGLVTDAADLSDAEVYQLIFEPGFTTAEQVSNISGRGVGMDVVRRTVEELRGSVEIETVPGQGSTLRVRLPLTLAIIDGFLIEAADGKFVLPLDVVEECVELDDTSPQDYVSLRGEVLPFLRLRELFGGPEEGPGRQSLVVVRQGASRAGIVADRLLGELQTVIKPLGELFSPVKWVSGCTVLGTGDVGLILDVHELIRSAGGGATRALHAAH